jgi:hypothetical protein
MLAALVVALSITVTPVDAASPCASGTLIATADDTASITREWTAGRALALPLDRALTWSIRTTATGCWAEPLTLPRDDARTEAHVRIWPSRTLGAKLILARGETFPANVSARIASPPGGAVVVTEIACARTAERVRCEVPAVPLDVRMAADGFAPLYFWDIDRDLLGDLHFRRGTIVTGRARSRESADAIAVELRPSSMAWSPEDRERVQRQRLATKTNVRGFFQFSDVPPGEYTVVATKKGGSPAEYRVHVSNVATEAVVGRELVIGELARLIVSIQPPTDAEQRPWTVALSRVVTGNAEPVARSEASPTGEWMHEALEQGIYGITVLDAAGATVATDAVRADGGPAHVALSIDSTPIRGTITLGGDAIEADLRFADPFGKRVDVRSDAEGRFAGTLPSQGMWNVEVRRGASRVTLRDVDVRRGESGHADLELTLPGGRVRGTVVDAAGQPQTANVTLFRDRRREATMRTDAEGAFAFEGVADGAVELSASARDGESGTITHTIADADDAPLRIVVQPRNAVRARVVAPDGRAVAGALVLWATHYAVQNAVSGPAGEVYLKVPPDVAAITLYVSAPGFPLKIARLRASAEDVADVRMPAMAGTVFISYDASRWPALTFGSGAERMNVGALRGMGPPRDDLPLRFTRTGVQIEVEPGNYTVCQARTDRCETRVVRAGTRETIDATAWSE